MSSNQFAAHSAPELYPTQTRRESRISKYTIAAGATALAAGATASQAAIIYSGPQNLSIGQGLSQNINLDGDAYNDILLKNYVFGGGNYQGATINFSPGKLVGFTSGLAYVTALSSGASIGTGTLGPSFFGSLAYGASNPNAQFNNATGAFIGLSFPTGAVTHMAWMRVNIKNSTGQFQIVDWAYETGNNVAILAGDTGVPEPTSLSFLAAGAGGLLLMRRRASATQA